MNKNRDLSILIYGLTIGCGAFLIFLIQPMVARALLPELGGAPVVWNVSQVFFQAALLAGYGYAHILTRVLAPTKQHMLHLGLLCSALLWLPFHFGSYSAGEPPAIWLLVELFTVVFPVFAILSATSPLLQRWLASTTHKHAKDPYFLYSASNVGSLLGLFAYPFVIEPTIGLRHQFSLFMTAFVGLILLFGVLVLSTRKLVKSVDGQAVAKISKEEIKWPDAIRWVLYAAVPSGLMLAVTNELTTEVASLPLLWIGPLSVYLISFIVVFARRAPRPELFSSLVVPVALILIFTSILGFLIPRDIALSGYLVGLFVLCCGFHGELVATRPSGENATAFYFLMSLGGIIGGSFVALLAPIIFTSSLELEVLALISLVVFGFRSNRGNDRRVASLAVAVGVTTTVALLYLVSTQRPTIWWVNLLLVLIVALLLYWQQERSKLSSSLLVILAAGLLSAQNVLSEPLFQSRSYFGTVKVIEESWGELGVRHSLRHGNTEHGAQFVKEPLSKEPLAYFYRGSGIGRLLASDIVVRGEGARIAVVGLGVGALAAYAERGEYWSFIEIDPLVVEVAEDPRFFTYLKNAVTDVKIEVGDGRVVVGTYPDKSLNVLVMDAYSSDSVPTHLLTSEAVEIYFQKLANNGVVAFHLSSRYWDLTRIVGGIAAKGDKDSWLIVDAPAGEWSTLGNYSVWMFLTNPGTLPDKEWEKIGAKRLVGDKNQAWTDDYINLLATRKSE